MLKKKIENILIGSNNKGKIKEIRDLIPKKYKIFTPSQFKLKSPVENGKSFKENSLIKAKNFSLKINMVCIADDSGLEIDLLNKKPGIYSARWAGSKSDFNRAIHKVYNELKKKDKNWQHKKIKARFICALSICYYNKKITCVRGRINGRISRIPKGKNGFGYDPIFIPEKHKKTFAEMKPSYKYKLDHRSKAFKKIKKFL